MTARPRAARARRAAPPPVLPAPPLALSHPGWIGAALVAAACLVVSVTFKMSDPDIWQHLLVGRVIWQTHSIPQTNLWSWPTYGEPQVLPSWAFRALLWPFWWAGGLWGLYAWRWWTTLAAFALGFAAARRMGARGLTTLVVIVLASLTWRHRSQVRPETLTAVLLALQVWILETRRTGGADRAWWIVPIAWLYANAHISYAFGLLVTGIYALDAMLASRRASRVNPVRAGSAAAPSTRLWRVLAASVAVSFANPFGWRALWQPFEYFLVSRHETIFRGISELRPVDWSLNLTNGLWLLLAGWVLLALWRWRRSGFDLAETLMLVGFVGIGLSSQRFLGLGAVLAVPYLGRDLDAWVATRRWPAWTRPTGARVALVAVTSVVMCVPEWRLERTPFGVGFDWPRYPVAACDYMVAQDVRGQGFNPFHFGGYQVWRFWPDRDRLPFMDIHQTGTPEARKLAAEALTSRDAYHELQSRWRFDYAVLDRRTKAQAPILDFFDQDTAWAAVFVDDAAALFVRRSGRLAALAARDAYRAWPAGWSQLNAVAQHWNQDPDFRAAARADLERQSRSSPWNAIAENFLANLALREADYAGARSHILAALRVEPTLPEAHLRLARIALRAGDRETARREYRRELALYPKSADAREQLLELEAAGAH
jgi:hypothetical protein